MTRKMEDSGIEWIGEIPEVWKISKIKYVSNLNGRIGFRGYKESDLVDNDEGAITLGPPSMDDGKLNLSNCKYLSWDKYYESPEIQVKVGDILLVKTASVGKVAYVNELKKEMTINPQILIIKSKNIKNKFLFYVILSDILQSQIKMSVTGGTVPTLSQEKIGNFVIIEPPFNIQNRIVEKLDSICLNIENVSNFIEKEIQTLEEYKKSVITEAVTKGLDKNIEMKDSGIEWIGEIPKHWELVKLKHIAEKISKGISPKYVEQQITPVVNQATFSNGVFNYDLKYCSDKPIGEGLLKKDDVLLATTGGGVLGKTYLFEEEGNYLASTDVAYLRFKNKNLSKLVYYILSVNYELLNGVYGKGSTNQTHLQMNMLSNMEIPITDLEELNQIIQAIDEKCSYIDGAIAAKQKQLETLEEYKKSLIYEYVTGKKEVEDVGTI